MNREIPLLELKNGQQGVVIKSELSGDIRRRLQDMGFVKGTKVRKVGQSPLGDPSAFMVKGAVIAIRSKDSKKIFVSVKG